jgi:putative ABC transport system permease protein
MRYAVRSLIKRPGFAIPVVATIALGVGATTTIFSVLDCVAFRDLPYPDSEELVFFENPAHAVPLFMDWRDRTSSFSAVAGAWDDDFDLAGEDQPLRVHGARITPGLLELFGASPHRGRLFLEDDYSGPPGTAIVTHRLWQSRWGGEQPVIGRTITVDGRPLTVVGVLGPDFELPQAGFRTYLDVLVPLDISEPTLQSRGMLVLTVVARLRPDVSLPAAQTELDLLSTNLAAEYPDRNQLRDGSPRMYSIVPLLDAMVGDVRGPLYLLAGAVTFLLLIACANVANMFLARGSDREHEMAVRIAMGAKRRRVVAQLLTESITISVVGGVAGVALATLGVEAVKLLEPGWLPRVDGITVDQRILWFALSLSVLTGVLFGLAPAAQASRIGVGDALKNAARAATVSRRRFKMRDALVVSEISIAFILLVGAGLLFNSFVRLVNVGPGFDADNLVTMRLTLGPTFTEAERSHFARDLEERLEAIPGIEGTAIGTTLPFYSHSGAMCCWMGGVDPEHEPDPDAPWTTIHLVSPDYFSVVGARMLQGRTLSLADDSGSAVVNSELANRMFGDGNPIGRTLYLRNMQFTVVGVVDNVKHWGLLPSLSEGDPRGHNVYLPHHVFAARFPRMAVALRSPLALATLAPALREAVWGLRPDLPLTEVTTMRARMTRSTADRRFFMAIIVLFAVVASLLASLGIYGSMLYSVRQRRRELGIRMALGALRGNVVTMVVRHGMLLTTVGIGLGLAGGLALSRTLASTVFGITTYDASTYFAVIVLLAAAALAACYLPARKAASVDPVETLRTE